MIILYSYGGKENGAYIWIIKNDFKRHIWWNHSFNRKEKLNEQWLELNSFKAARIDFTFDLHTMNQQYLKLID